ncbi:MAG: Hpt domain-containing protein [Cognatishimia sp.]|uniref:Hpt domain-containing protein n=1 Tax=Cognatishimia sp. TaxID=2211648 RepID=UPI003B8D27B6
MLDWTHIDQLKKDVGSNEFAEIVDLFFVEVEGLFKRLNREGAVANDLHFLKGSAANLGFAEFSKSCQIAQHQLVAGQQADLQQIVAVFEQSKHAFIAGLAQRQV